MFEGSTRQRATERVNGAFQPFQRLGVSGFHVARFDCSTFSVSTALCICFYYHATRMIQMINYSEKGKSSNFNCPCMAWRSALFMVNRREKSNFARALHGKRSLLWVFLVHFIRLMSFVAHIPLNSLPFLWLTCLYTFTNWSPKLIPASYATWHKFLW